MAGFQDLADSVVARCVSLLGREVTYRATSTDEDADPVSLTVICSQAEQPSEYVPGRYLRASLRLADLEEPPKTGDELSIDGTDYSVVRVDIDGQGVGAQLLLREDA